MLKNLFLLSLLVFSFPSFSVTINTSHVEYQVLELYDNDVPVEPKSQNFKIEIDGVISGGFKSVSGLESEVEVIEFKDGSDPITHKRPGKAKYKNIVLKREFSLDRDGWTRWKEELQSGKVSRKSISIIFQNDDSDISSRVISVEKLNNCLPVKWMSPETTRDQKSVAPEEIQLINCESEGRKTIGAGQVIEIIK